MEARLCDQVPLWLTPKATKLRAHVGFRLGSGSWFQSWLCYLLLGDLGSSGDTQGLSESPVAGYGCFPGFL